MRFLLIDLFICKNMGPLAYLALKVWTLVPNKIKDSWVKAISKLSQILQDYKVPL